MANGHVKLHRSIVNSAIYTKPPLYLRVFERLILEANWKDGEVMLNGLSVAVKRGERITSIRQIAEWVAWYERGVLKTPNPKTIKDVITWLVTAKMLTMYRSVSPGNSQVTHYNVLNYSQYQGLEPDEVTAKVTVAGEQSNSDRIQTIRGKKEKKVKKDILYDSSDEESRASRPERSTAFTPPTVDEVATYCRERHNTVDAQYWHDFYDSKGWMIGKNKMKDWKAAVRTWERNKDNRANDKDFSDRSFQNQNDYQFDERGNLKGAKPDNAWNVEEL